MALVADTYSRTKKQVSRVIRNDSLVLAVLAIFIGVGVGGAIIGFREFIDLIQYGFYGDDTERLSAHLEGVPWWQRLIAPIAAGLAVGLLIKRFMTGGRPQGVADVIEASALRGGKMSAKDGFFAMLTSAISIGGGASVGREGPAIHFGGTLASLLAQKLGLNRNLRQTLLGCGVAAAVAASFNTPLAGALFANEVVIGHYALKAFAPVVIASVAATAVSRLYFGDFPAFALVDNPIASFWEFPAFVLLGLVCGLATIIMIKGHFLSAKLAARTPIPPWTRPAVAGVILGIAGLQLPQIMGIGYGVTEDAMFEAFDLDTLLILIVAKMAAVVLCTGWGFAGGVFGPALVLGALIGSAFGIIATSVFPELSAGPPAYTVVGMGAMAAAVMGAPISTTLIIFEMTGDYTLTLGVMVAVVVSSEVSHQLQSRSFFHSQLAGRGIDLREGIESEITQTISVVEVMETEVDRVDPATSLDDLRQFLQKAKSGELFVVQANGKLLGTITLADMSEYAFTKDMDAILKADDVTRRHPPVLSRTDDLESAIQTMRETGEYVLAVVDDTDNMTLLGAVSYHDIMTAYNKALITRRQIELGRN